MSKSLGFTLIELMITVAIIAILAAIALPSYSQYLLRGKLSDAVAGLSDQKLKMEQFFQDKRSYTGACTAGTVAPPQPSTGNFQFSCSIAADGSTYSVAASGINSMSNFRYTIDSTGTKTTTSVQPGWTLGTCGWVLKPDGSC